MKNKVRLPAHVKPERYKIMLRPDLEGFTFYGEEIIDLSLEKPTRQITLHSADLEIESAEFIHRNEETWPARNASSPDNATSLRAGRSEAGGAAQISYDPKAETATFAFPKKVQKGKGQLKLIFRGILNDKMRGFYRSRYEVAGVSKHLATTQFESTDARRAFPCFDEPSQKAIFDVTLMVPGHTTAISNTIESNVLEHESGYQQAVASGYKIVEFAPTPKMSTYLLAFIVGEFEYVEAKTKNGILVRVFTTQDKKEQARFALDVAAKCLDFYGDYFAIPYPLPLLDMIAIPDFASGAMENWGAVTYRESTLLIDEEHSSSANKQWVALVIAHELAHQWFGNLVTMKWWSDLWLNEGFASFIEYLAIDHIFPQWDIWTQFVGSEMTDAFHLDSLKNTHPIEVEVGDPAEISEIFDKVSYAKGASILRMLMSYLGERDFQKGLQHYLLKHAYGNAETLDLWKAFEEVSGKPVRKIMANWTGKPGHPLVSVKCKAKSAKLELTQSRFFSSPISKKETKDNTIWSIPLTSLRATAKQSTTRPSFGGKRIATSPSAPRNDGEWLMDKKSITIPNTGEKLNLGEVSLVRVDYPRDYLHRLESSIKNGELSAPDRLGLIRDSFDLAQAGGSPTALAMELALSCKDDEDYTVWSALTGQLSQLDSLLAYESFYGDFRKYGKKVYGAITKKMGWEKRKEEKHTDGLLRGMVLNMLGGFGDEEVVKTAQSLFGRKIEPDLKSVVYNLVAENGGLGEFSTLIKMYKEEDNQQERDRIGRSLGRFKDKLLLSKTLDFAISKHVRFQNSLQIIASVWSNPTGRYLAWEFVKKNWELLKERYAGGHYFPRVFPPMGNFTKISDAKEIEKFIAKNPVPEAKRTIAQALEQIYSNVEWLKRDRKRIEKFLEKNSNLDRICGFPKIKWNSSPTRRDNLSAWLRDQGMEVN